MRKESDPIDGDIWVQLAESNNPGFQALADFHRKKISRNENLAKLKNYIKSSLQDRVGLTAPWWKLHTTPVGVLSIGLALSLFGSAFGVGASVRVPFTEDNISLAGSIGSSQKTRQVLPNYLERRVASNQDFINSSVALTVGPSEGTGLLVVGNQSDAPWVDLHIGFART
jgi:hypothetical protein